ncbi:hypothetical protein [Paenibacillus pinistramenti]|uniref:hypothetical protein n=1 Tax=Paenibacillus pinistramenti TaxID=1768003 RepID=UPI001109D6E9|nr:hypothetical protein [Paenibacillus pinistramenti]
MQNLQLTADALKSQGWAYQFNLSVLADQSEGVINEYIHNIHQSAIQTLSKQKSKKMLKGPFYI